MTSKFTFRFVDLFSAPIVVEPVPEIERPFSSAGVFTSDDVLVRTLWSGTEDHLQTFAPVWDGLLDDGSVAPAGSYVAKVLRHNWTYTWDGVIGNTSPKADHIAAGGEDGLLYHNGSATVRDMCITAAGEIYFVDGYTERWNTAYVMDEDNIQSYHYVLKFRSSQQKDLMACCTDGTRVYYARVQFSSSYIWAVSTADFAYDTPWGIKEIVTFGANGTSFEGGVLFGIAWSTTGQFIMDLAVQQTGNFLFMNRWIDSTPTGYTIWTIHKTTGATITSTGNDSVYPYQNVIAINPVDDRLWVAHSAAATPAPSTIISEMIADGSGILTETGVHITGLTNILNFEVSPDGSYILVTDVGTQQIKAFNTSDGSVKTAWATSGVFGTAGGYLGSPLVTDTKFDLLNFGQPGGFSSGGGYIAFSSDSSFWVGDGGNFRNLHFSAGNSPTLIEKFAYVPSGYSVRECRGDPTRVLFEGVEWEINYSIPLGIDNGSWTLKRNYTADIRALSSVPQPYQFLRWYGVYSNGRYYGGCIDITDVQKMRIFEVTATGLRDTGKTLRRFDHIDRDMNIWNYAANSGGGGEQIQWKRNAFTGFDGSENPTWEANTAVAPATVIYTSAVTPTGFPVAEIEPNHSSNINELLSNGSIPIFSVHSFGVFGSQVGLVNSVTGAIKGMCLPTTNNNYGGANLFLQYPKGVRTKGFFPIHGNFPIIPEGMGTGVGDNGGGSCFYEPGDDNFFVNYYGETYGGNQTNVIYHYHESGLLINQFGPDASAFGLLGSLYPFITDFISDAENRFTNANSENLWKGLEGMAGNAFQGGLVKVDEKYYLYQNDEWYHGGIHRWTIDGADVLQVNNHPITWDGSFVTPTDPNNLLLGLPYNTLEVPDNTAGWTRDPTTNFGTISPAVPFWRIYTSAIFPSIHGVPDLAIQARFATAPWTLTRELPRTGVGNWSIDGEIIMKQTVGAADAPAGYAGWPRLDILDDTGKVIVRIHNSLNQPRGLHVNEALAIDGGFESWSPHSQHQRALIISADMDAGELTVQYGQFTVSGINVFEVGADISAPDAFQIVAPTSAANGFLEWCITKLDWIE